MIQETRKTTTIHKNVNEMRHIMTNTTFDLCCDGLQEIRDVERLEAALTENKIVYCSSVRNASMSTSDSDSSMS